MIGTRAVTAGPWTRELRVRRWTFNAVGLALAVVGWYQCADSDQTDTQLRWIEFSVAGLVIAAIGNALWVLHGRRAVGTAARTLFGVELPAALPSLPGASVLEAGDVDLLLAAPGTIRYHRAGCALLTGHVLDSLDLHPRAVHERHSRRACEVCTP